MTPLETPPSDETALDADRARLIGSIYEVVLRPEHFESFMADWSEFVDDAARRLGELRVTEGQASRHLDDPVIEAHFRRAFALFERMGRGESVLPGVSAALAPLLRLGRGGVILDAAPEAMALFGEAPTLATLRDALHPDSAARLSAFLAAQDRAPASGRFAVLALDAAPGALLAVVTQRDPTGEAFCAEVRPLTIGWTPLLASTLSSSFRLTPREVDLVRDLSQGEDLAQIVARTGRSMNTLRAQLKSVFAKTRTTAQSDLIRLVAALMLHSPDGPPDSRAAEPLAPPGRDRMVDLGEGRILPVQCLGREDGLPVIFLHGMLEGLASLNRFGPVLAGTGLRLIAPMRPNFGASLIETRVREAPDLFARDLDVMLQRLRLERVVLIGHMAGTIYAHAAAARLRNAVAGLVTLSGCVPIRSIEQFASMTPRQRAVAYTARFAPALLPAVLRAGIAQLDSRSADAFMTSLYAPGSRDRAAIDHLGLAEIILDGYRYTVAQGPRAFQIDAYHVTRDWSALVEGGACPVHMVHGALDPVVSLASVQAFIAGRNRFTLHAVEGEGQLIAYSQPETVLAEVATFARACLAP